VETKDLVDARKTRMGPKEAMALLDGANELLAAKGKKVERIDLRKGKPDKATMARLMIGPSGNLRAPTLRVGKKILVGFDEETYEKVLG
jgi:arsenate reductase-like glutaredoxin family protein